MKYLIFIGLFVAGGLTGYFLGVNQEDDGSDDMVFVEPQMITEFVYDTIVEKETIEVPVYEERSDTVEEPEDTLSPSGVVLDTLSEQIVSGDSLDKEELSIRRDELIASKRIAIQYLEDLVEKDSLIKEMLGIKPVLPEEMVVQFWNSPVGYTGYKLSKNTLVLYGFSEQFEYKVYGKGEKYYLSNQEIFYQIKETNEFLPVQEVDATEIFDD